LSDSLLGYILKKVERFPGMLFWESDLMARSAAEFQQLRELQLLRPVREDAEQLLYPCPSGRSCQGSGRQIVKTDGQLRAICTCPAEEPPVPLHRDDVRRCAFNLDSFTRSLREANGLKGTPDRLDERLFCLGESEFSGRRVAWVFALPPDPEDAAALLDLLPGRLPSSYDTILVLTPSCAPMPMDAVRLEGRGIHVLAGVTDHALRVPLNEVLGSRAWQGAGVPATWPDQYFQDEEEGYWLTAKILSERYEIPDSRLKQWREKGCPDLDGDKLAAKKVSGVGWVYFRMHISQIANRRDDRGKVGKKLDLESRLQSASKMKREQQPRPHRKNSR